MRIAPSLQVTETERQQLEQWARGRRTPARLVLRAKIALVAAVGHDNQHIAVALDTSRQTVGLWRHRVATQRPPGLAQDAPRGGRPPQGAPGTDRAHSEDDDPDDTAWRHPLVDPPLGSAPADESYVRAAGLDCPWFATPPSPSLQAQPGSALPGQAGGCGGPVSAPARACRGPQRG